MTPPAPQSEHQWLQQLVGEWTAEMEASMAPDQPPEKFTSVETVRSVGQLWVVCEHRGQMPGGGEATGIITLGFDPARGRFVGTFVGSMMTHLWVYDGQLDDARRVLTLDTVGPGADGKLTPYQDVYEIHAPNERTLTSRMQGADGQWTTFMEMRYRRKT